MKTTNLQHLSKISFAVIFSFILIINSVKSQEQNTFSSPQKHLSKQSKELYSRLEAARLNNNVPEKQRIEQELARLNGGELTVMTEAPGVYGGSAKQLFISEGDYQVSTIAGGIHYSSATQTNPSNFPNPGRIWVACTKYANNASDSLKVYYSDNGGQSWTLGYFLVTAPGVDFKPGELDIELIYDGTTMFIYGVAGYNDISNNRQYGFLFRFNTTSGVLNASLLSWPGTATFQNKYYNPRITSDNTVHSALAYVVLTCSFDSTYGGTQHYVGMKFAKIVSPYTTPIVVDYTMANGGVFSWFTTGRPATDYLWQDVGHTRSSAPSDRIYTVYYCEGAGGGTINLAYTDNYGTSITQSSIIPSGGTPKSIVRLAFNGGSGIFSGVITFKDLGSFINPGYAYTTNSGTVWFIGNFINNSVNLCRTIDVQAIRGVNNKFKFAYILDSAGNSYGYYKGGSPTNFVEPSATLVSSSGTDTSFTKIIAGYKTGGGDDCFAVYSNSGGNNVIGSRLCQTTVGITGNNQIPNEFSLQQNYPNPFNPTTNIKFGIPKSSFVRLAVYDVSGREIAALVNSNLDAGNYSYDFNGEGLASGVYFYKLEASGFSQVKKMVLIK